MTEEMFVATNVETRTLLTFRVSDTVLQSILPDGWQLNPSGGGPSKGANLSVNFVDQLVALYTDGAVGPPLRLLPLTMPVRRKDTETTANMPFHAFASHSSYPPGPYGVHRLGKIDFERNVCTDAAGNSQVKESWELNTANEDRIALRLRYLRGAAVKGTTETKVYSAVRPDFFRIYRIEQATDVVRGPAAETDRVQEFSFKASGQMLSRLFDGSEQLISITSVPWHSRQIFLPKGVSE